MLEKNLIFIPWNTRIYPGIPRNTQEYPEIAESKKGSRKYPTLHFNTPTQPEPNPLSGIFSNTWPESGQVLKNPIRWALLLTAGPSSSSFQPQPPQKRDCVEQRKVEKNLFLFKLGMWHLPPSLPDWRLQTHRSTENYRLQNVRQITFWFVLN